MPVAWNSRPFNCCITQLFLIPSIEFMEIEAFEKVCGNCTNSLFVMSLCYVSTEYCQFSLNNDYRINKAHIKHHYSLNCIVLLFHCFLII